MSSLCHKEEQAERIRALIQAMSGLRFVTKGGDIMAEYPLKIFEKLDPELLKLVENTRDLALADGALPKKFKLLIAMALDASHGTVEGVKALAQVASEAGATKEEITEALRVAQYISGVGSVYTAAHALKELF
jgi:alkylhydroperoxidase/carboxymuconolactone decarboxylase family protein YurZ